MIRGAHPVTHLTQDGFERLLFNHPGLVGSYGGTFPEVLLNGRCYVADVPALRPPVVSGVAGAGHRSVAEVGRG